MRQTNIKKEMYDFANYNNGKIHQWANMNFMYDRPLISIPDMVSHQFQFNSLKRCTKNISIFTAQIKISCKMFLKKTELFQYRYNN